MPENWEDALMVAVTRRRNRRANTQGLTVRHNTAFRIRRTEDGFGVSGQNYYYARHLNGGLTFTGPRSEGIVLHLQNSTR